MALADIINLVSEEAKGKIEELTKATDEQIKVLLDKSAQDGEKYSVQKFEEFEILQKELEKKSTADITRNEKIKTAEFTKSISDEIFTALEKEIFSFSEKDQIDFFARQISKISDSEGEIIAQGTTTSVLEEAVKSAGKNFTVVDGDEKENGGFIFKGKGFTSDFTITSLVQGEFKDANEADLVEKLFA